MVRIRHILDPDLRQKVIDKLAEQRGMSPASIPEWFELDDADYVDLLMQLRSDAEDEQDERDDPRM